LIYDSAAEGSKSNPLIYNSVAEGSKSNQLKQIHTTNSALFAPSGREERFIFLLCAFKRLAII